MNYVGRSGKNRSQSAMEFLMTYGWSILIIAVVLGAMFQLGVFNSANLGPRAPTGNCKILRVAGMSNLEGTCSGVLPQEVAMFNGQSSYINVGSGASLQFSHSTGFSISAWIKTSSSATQEIARRDGAGSNGYYLLRTSGTKLQLQLLNHDASQTSTINGGTNIAKNQWVYVVGVRDTSNMMKLYVNGISDATPTPDTTTDAVGGANLIIGSTSVPSEIFNGSIADVQIYNTSLDANQIQALYLKGIGAAPIDPNHIVGWWPLNGDANDYSGNNNGAAASISYTGSWSSGYTPP